MTVVDKSGTETEIECVVLEKPCGNVLPLGDDIFKQLPSHIARDQEHLKLGGEVEIIIGMNAPKLHR